MNHKNTISATSKHIINLNADQIVFDIRTDNTNIDSKKDTHSIKTNPKFLNETKVFWRYLSSVKDYCDKLETNIKNQGLDTETENNLIAFHCEIIRKKVDKKITNHFNLIWKFLIADTQFSENNLTDQYLRYKTIYQRMLKPLFVVTDFIKQIHYKPLGYAGDFRMLDTIYRRKGKSRNLYQKVIDGYTVDIGLGHSVRDRSKFVSTLILNKISDIENLKILSVAAGAAEEIFHLHKNNQLKNSYVTLLDTENQALLFSRNRIRLLNPNINLRTINANILDLILSKITLETQDIIYSLGLFDYLSDTICVKLIRVLFKALNPGGTLVIGNVSNKDYSRAYMALIGEWYLIHRNTEHLKKLAQKSIPNVSTVDVFQDKSGIQLYLTIQKTT